MIERTNDKKRSQIFFALNDEVDPGFFEFKNQITIMGIGKLNAAMALLKHINHGSGIPTQIINLGTCGSIKWPLGSLVEVTEFYERGTAFRSPKITQMPKTALPSARCGTGDLVESFAEGVPWECMDMESYALAKICQEYQWPFVSVKYVTDTSKGDVKSDWKKNLAPARTALFQFWKNYLKDYEMSSFG